MNNELFNLKFDEINSDDYSYFWDYNSKNNNFISVIKYGRLINKERIINRIKNGIGLKIVY